MKPKKIEILIFLTLKGEICNSSYFSEEHLKGTDELAKSFAAEFSFGECAYLAGLWHVLGSRFIRDLGKI